MEQAPNDTSARSANSEFTFDPTNKIVGIIDDPSSAKAALRDLRAAGFTADEIEVPSPATSESCGVDQANRSTSDLMTMKVTDRRTKRWRRLRRTDSE
jgi:hypothetical protein